MPGQHAPLQPHPFSCLRVCDLLALAGWENQHSCIGHGGRHPCGSGADPPLRGGTATHRRPDESGWTLRCSAHRKPAVRKLRVAVCNRCLFPLAPNESYRERFGFPFIICARLTTREGVLSAFVARLKNRTAVEISEAIHEIHHIARLRIEDRIMP